MKIFSWNMLHYNADFDHAFSYIANLEFDILCLQEVPVHFLERLKTLPFNIAHGNDVDRLEPPNVVRDSLAILTPHPIIRSRSFPLPIPDLPLRTRLFVRAMYFMGFRKIANRGGLWADIAVPGLTSPVRVFCLHLLLAYPEIRREEFELAMRNLDPETIPVICGDFNILEWPGITILNWILGGRVRDVFAWRAERHSLERKFSQLSLQNPLRGKPTQTISRSQLDHILVPKDLTVMKAEVLPDRIGSDHHPIFVECR